MLMKHPSFYPVRIAVKAITKLVVGFGIAAFSASTLAEEHKAGYIGHSLINYDMPYMVEQIATSMGDTHQTSVQVNNGMPLRLNYSRSCHQADFQGEYPPANFICDEMQDPSIAKFDSLVVTDANNTIESNYIWGQTDVYLELFTEKLKNHNPDANMYLYTSWESLDLHGDMTQWLSAIDGELSLYEEMVTSANQLAQQKGYAGEIKLIPTNLAIKKLVEAVQAGQVPGINSYNQVFFDDVHLSPMGNYYVATLIYSALFNKQSEGATGYTTNVWGEIRTDLPLETSQALQALSWQVLEDYNFFDTPPPPAEPSLNWVKNINTEQVLNDTVVLSISSGTDLNSLNLSVESSGAMVTRQGDSFAVTFEQLNEVDIHLYTLANDQSKTLHDTYTFNISAPDNNGTEIQNYQVIPDPFVQGVDISWLKPDVELQYYKLLLNGAATYLVPADAESFELDWLPVDSPIGFALQGYDHSHNLVVSSPTVHVIPGDSEAPSQPQIESAQYTPGRGAELIWSEPEDNAGIFIYKIFRNGQAYTLSQTPSFVDYWPPHGRVTYQISALDFQQNESERSDVVSITVE